MIPKPNSEDSHRLRRRAEILAEAQTEFQTLGFEKASMADISVRSGGSKETIWAYFNSKEEVFFEMVDLATKVFRYPLAELLKHDEDMVVTLTEFCENFLRLLITPDRLALSRVVMAEALRFPEVAAMFYVRGPEALQSRLADYLKVCVSRGWLRNEPPLEMAQALTALALGAEHRRTMFLGEVATAEQIKHRAQKAMEQFLRIYDSYETIG